MLNKSGLSGRSVPMVRRARLKNFDAVLAKNAA